MQKDTRAAFISFVKASLCLFVCVFIICKTEVKKKRDKKRMDDELQAPQRNLAGKGAKLHLSGQRR